MLRNTASLCVFLISHRLSCLTLNFSSCFRPSSQQPDAVHERWRYQGHGYKTVIVNLKAHSDECESLQKTEYIPLKESKCLPNGYVNITDAEFQNVSCRGRPRTVGGQPWGEAFGSAGVGEAVLI